MLTGLAEGTPVAGGAGDQAAGAVGNGIVRPGAVSSTIGTSGVVFACTTKVKIDPMGRVHTFCHAVPDTWHIMGVTQAAGLSLRWFRDNFCMTEKETAGQLGIDPYELLNREAALAASGCEGLIYLPYLMGERTPHLDPDSRGVFFGLSARHTRRDMLRAVMEGVAYSLKDCMEIIKGMGIIVNEVRASGGGGKSVLWRQMQADVFETGISAVNTAEGPALGAALLAGAGTGIYKSVPEACDTVIKTAGVQNPSAVDSKIYAKYYPIYRELYAALKEQFKAVGKMAIGG
jgi:xylulokinase